MGLLLTTDKPVWMSSEIDRLNSMDTYSFRRSRCHSRMIPKYYQPNHPVEEGAHLSRVRENIGEVAYAKCQVEDHHMRVKILVVTAMARVQGEVRGRITPRGVRHVNEHISAPCSPMAYLLWDCVIASPPEPYFNAGISRSRHDIVSTTIEVKWCAVGGATVGEGDTTPLVGVSKCVAVVAGGSPAASFFV